MKKISHREKRNRIIFFTILFTYIITIIFVSFQMLRLHGDEVSSSGRTVADYAFMLFECVGGLVLMFLPSFVAKKITLKIPFSLYVVYVVFIYFAIYLGEVWHFFYKFKYWDVMLHSFSGIALGALGFSIVAFLNKDEHVRMSLTPFFVAFFAFCFGLAFGALWEICEFTIDGVFGLNMQKFALADGTQLVGRKALMDTMKDLIVDTVGVLTSTVIGYLTIMRDRTQNSIRKDAKDE